jgi:tetratricopeptide (TPR) repeat protein
LALAEQAVNLARKLAAEKPERYEAIFATFLDNYAIIASRSKGRQFVEVAEEALAVWQRLALAKPARFEQDLATSLSNYATQLGGQGRDREAVVFDERALRIRQRLANAEPARFDSDLATSFHNLAVHLGGQGRIEEALSADERALEIRSRLVSSNAERFEPDLALSFTALAEHHAYIGNWNDAPDWERRAAFLFDRAATRAPHLYVINREISLLALDVWEWLRLRTTPESRRVTEEMRGYLSERDQRALAFKQACVKAYTSGDAYAISRGIDDWKALDATRQTFFLDDYLTLCALAQVLDGGNHRDRAWHEQFRKFGDARLGRLPRWMTEIVNRFGGTLPS